MVLPTKNYLITRLDNSVAITRVIPLTARFPDGTSQRVRFKSPGIPVFMFENRELAALYGDDVAVGNFVYEYLPIEEIVDQAFAPGIVAGFQELSAGAEAELPDRAWRDQWSAGIGGKVEVDMVAARAEVMKKVRRRRNGELDALDKVFIKALGQGRTDDATAVEAVKQRLRDLPQVFEPILNNIETPDKLKAAWPEELG